MSDDIRAHTGGKYVRPIRSCVTHAVIGEVDVYSVADAFAVADMPVAHALKKVLCAGLRGKGDRLSDLCEARDALTRAIQIERGKAAPEAPPGTIAVPVCELRVVKPAEPSPGEPVPEAAPSAPPAAPPLWPVTLELLKVAAAAPKPVYVNTLAAANNWSPDEIRELVRANPDVFWPLPLRGRQPVALRDTSTPTERPEGPESPPGGSPGTGSPFTTRAEPDAG